MNQREWWNGRWMLPLAALATAAPMLWPRIPPLTDVPSHMASYHVSTMLDRSPTLQRFFDFHWQLFGNLGVDLAVVPLTPLVGIELATKLVVLGIPVLTALGLLLVARQAHGHLPATALAALPLVYNYPFIFGFVNYALSVALALVALALWLRWPSDRRPVLRAAVFAAIAATVWLSHAIGWVMLCVMCGAAELSIRRGAGQSWLRSLTGTTIACLCLLVPIVLTALGSRADTSSTFDWFDWHGLAKAVIEPLHDRWEVWDIASATLLVALAGAALIRLGRLRLAPPIIWSAVALFVLFVAAPFGLNGSLFVNTRISPYALALAIVSIDTRALSPSRRHILATGAALFCAARLLGNTISFAQYEASYARELAALDHIPRGAAVLVLTEMPCQKWYNKWYEDRAEHLAGLATVRKDAFVNVLWDIKGLHLMTNHMAQAGRFRSDPSQFVSKENCPFYSAPRATLKDAPLDLFTHLWLIGVPPDQRIRDRRLSSIWASGNSILYRISPTMNGGR